jgi:DMSO/TMAO reductase YedYZ molybdopterin-dependent catalytic subunit
VRRRQFLEGVSLSALAALLPKGGESAEPELLVASKRPENLATPPEYFDRLITPTSVFFVRSHFGAPPVDLARTLKLEGRKTLELDPKDLRRTFKTATVTAVLECAGNSRGHHEPTVPGVQWSHGAMGQAEWTGVRLKDVIEAAGVPDGAAWVRLMGADRPPHEKVPRFVRGIPLERAIDETTLIATHMNGEPLPHAHGGPLRLVVPGWTGNHWLKWLKAISIQKDAVTGFYMEMGYRMPGPGWKKGDPMKSDNSTPVATLALRSVIAKPVEGSTVRPGGVEVAGVAFSGDRSIAKVEVSIDGGSTWVEAKLEGTPGAGRWQVFRHRFEVKSTGSHGALARATDDAGTVQPKDAAWNPSGYLWNGWHEVRFEV